MLRVTLSKTVIRRPFASSSCLRDAVRSQQPPPTNEQHVPHQSPNPSTLPASSDIKQVLPGFLSVKQMAQQWSETAAIAWRKLADDFTTSTKTKFSHLGSHLNKVTGYEEIEALKKQVVQQEARIATARQAARRAKTAHDEAVVQRSNSQREVNDLLQRKSSWTDNDVSRFTTLVRQDHFYEQNEVRAKVSVAQTEDEVEKEFSELMRSILARYHEEQVWSDKIRSASTYGSLAALGLNVVIFLMAIAVVEPWKRRRLKQTFEKKIEEMSLENAALMKDGIGELRGQLEEQSRLISSVVKATPETGQEREDGLLSIIQPLENAPNSRASKQESRATWNGEWELAAVAVVLGWLARSVWGR